MKSHHFLVPIVISLVALAPLAAAKKTVVLLPEKLLDAQGREVSREILAGKFVGVYVSASWCGPCRSFTPKLIKFRNANAKDFEVVLVGGDATSKAQANYMKKYGMPWPAVKNGSSAANLLVKKLKVQVIPYLVILAPDGSVVTKGGKDDVDTTPSKAMAKWKKLASN